MAFGGRKTTSSMDLLWMISQRRSPVNNVTSLAVISLNKQQGQRQEAPEVVTSVRQEFSPKSLTASEEAKLQLLEKVSLLEKRLQAVSQRSAGGESYENMVLEKDKCIEKLQAEVKASQEKLTAHCLTDSTNKMQLPFLVILQYQVVLESVMDGGLGNKLSDIDISKSMVQERNRSDHV
ncbi:hypothetical protein ACRRTK_020786 [Alexandromys fortis]